MKNSTFVMILMLIVGLSYLIAMYQNIDATSDKIGFYILFTGYYILIELEEVKNK
jgi:hypothetical protein